MAVPALGMEEIPKQLVALLPKNSIRCNTQVVEIVGNKVTIADGTVFEANQILLATNASALTKDFFPAQKMTSHQVTNVYFEATEAPTKKAVVTLNASKNKKWVNNLTIMSNVSSAYAPKGKVLISVSYNGIPTLDDAALAENMKRELKKWFGQKVNNWKMLKVYRIEYALPTQESVRNEIPASEIKISDTLFICGDNLLNGSINAAMKTGRLAAEAMQL